MTNRQSLNIYSFLIVMSRGKDDQGQDVIRPYTPITLDSDTGYFEIVVKVYF